MAIELEGLLALQVSALPDTVVSLIVAPPLTAFDYASGTLQILVLVIGFFALAAMALLLLTLRKTIVALQGTVDRLTADTKPLLHQATRLTEDAHDMVKTVRREVDRLAEATGEVRERIVDVSDMAKDRIDQVNALLNVLQDEVEDTALGAVAAARGLKVGAVALGAALVGNSSRSARRKSRKQSPRIRAREDATRPLFGEEPETVTYAADSEKLGDVEDVYDVDDIDDIYDVNDADLDDVDDDLEDDDDDRPYFDDDDDVDEDADDDVDDDVIDTDKSAARRRPR